VNYDSGTRKTFAVLGGVLAVVGLAAGDLRMAALGTAASLLYLFSLSKSKP
jgi:hypothetical protein